MVKKQSKKNKTNELTKTKKDNIIGKYNENKSKKFSIKVSSKMKKKLKYTQNKLKIDKSKIEIIISHIKKEEPPLNKEISENNSENEGEDLEDIGQEGGV